jgi:UDP-N-acetylmuramoyl-L-alanyl-D-glutamate--2,6-diaminopimelate ligase
VSRPPIPFRELLEPVRQADLLREVRGDEATPVASLAHDSRAVEPGACFFAWAGAAADGHAYLDQAAARGAVTAVVERPLAEAPASLRAVARVTDARAALAEAASLYYGHPSRLLDLVGVTGTNGKTTTAFLLHHALCVLGVEAGMIGTVEVRIGDRVVPATHTTPDALALNALLAEMVEAECGACAMEVSSHALAQARVRGQRFAVAAFTNLTHDHLDYHSTAEEYAAAKAMLFTGLDAAATAVLNRDDPAWSLMGKGTPARVVTYGREAAGHRPPPGVAYDIGFSVQENALAGLRLRLDGETRRFRLAGAFNAYNLAAAYGILRALGHAAGDALDALASAPPVPGRLETVLPTDAVSGPIAVVDYAHTPDALENVLRTVREMVPAGGRLAVVFGCGGDRDRAKRPVMGRLAESLADRVILTSDNPRTEPPEDILQAIAGGMSAPPGAVIANRQEAIHAALAEARAQDVVVVAGKGHETYQIVGTETRPFDDRAVVRAALKARTGGVTE